MGVGERGVGVGFGGGGRGRRGVGVGVRGEAGGDGRFSLLPGVTGGVRAEPVEGVRAGTGRAGDISV